MYDKLTYKFDYQIEKSPMYPMDYKNVIEHILLNLLSHILLKQSLRFMYVSVNDFFLL